MYGELLLHSAGEIRIDGIAATTPEDGGDGTTFLLVGGGTVTVTAPPATVRLAMRIAERRPLPYPLDLTWVGYLAAVIGTDTRLQEERPDTLYASLAELLVAGTIAAQATPLAAGEAEQAVEDWVDDNIAFGA
jgi:hypothetical protein